MTKTKKYILEKSNRFSCIINSMKYETKWFDKR